jgi:hypothetical protein
VVAGANEVVELLVLLVAREVVLVVRGVVVTVVDVVDTADLVVEVEGMSSVVVSVGKSSVAVLYCDESGQAQLLKSWTTYSEGIPPVSVSSGMSVTAVSVSS